MMDMDKAQEIEADLSKKITELIVNAGESTMERQVASIAAVANVLCILALNIVGDEEGPNAIASMVNRAIANLTKARKEKKGQ